MSSTLESARATLLAEEAQFTKLSVPVADLRMEPGSLCVGSQTILDLSDEGLERICQEVKAPYGYVSKLQPEIQAGLIQHHIERGDLAEGDIDIIVRNQKLVSIDRDSLYRLKGVEVLDAVCEGVSHVQLVPENLNLSGDSFSIDLVSESHYTEVSPGDILRGGVRLTHSFVGEVATSVEAFVVRLRCKNGLTHRECISRGTARTRRLPSSRPDAHLLQLNQIRRLAAEAVRPLQTKLETLKSLDHEQVEVGHLLRRWIERARLSSRLLWPLLHDAWQQEGGRPTAYDAMNALTRVGTHAKNLDARTRRSLASLAGILAFRQIHFCRRCFSLVNAPTVAS